MTLIQPPPPPLSLRILTQNIRYATTSPFRGEAPWPTRLPRLLSSLRFHTHHIPPAIICLQEALHSQLLDILSGMNKPHHSSPPTQPEWTFIGVGRDDGVRAGEFSPILYRPAIFELLSSRTLWLSLTPHVPGSKSWDAALPRILTIGVFQHRASKRRIVIMNTHLDDRGVWSRTASAKMIVNEVLACGEGEGDSRMPVLLAGDFNSEVDGGAYRVLTGDASPMVDLRELVQERERYGHENTYTGFGFEEEKRPTRIDFLFVTHGGGGSECESGSGSGRLEDVVEEVDNEGMGLRKENAKGKAWAWKEEERPCRVDHYGVLENRFEDGVFVSDHRAVVGDVTLS